MPFSNDGPVRDHLLRQGKLSGYLSFRLLPALVCLDELDDHRSTLLLLPSFILIPWRLAYGTCTRARILAGCHANCVVAISDYRCACRLPRLGTSFESQPNAMTLAIVGTQTRETGICCLCKKPFSQNMIWIRTDQIPEGYGLRQ